ncbi:MAG: hypothetical protein PHC34_08030 [Candidatus Gastranaerophilales bacterium]|nr:hypothetical protein [Candidatus Gastranaerophilales bacterium]
MDNFINKQNIFTNNSSVKINYNENKSNVKETIDTKGLMSNLFESLSNPENNFSWKDNLEEQIFEMKNQATNLKEMLDTRTSGINFNIVV